MENDNKLGFVFLGLGVGAAVGVFLAPKSGAATRQYLRTRAEDAVDYANDRASDLRDGTRQALSRGKDVLAETRRNLREAVDVGKQTYRHSMAESPSESASMLGVLLEAAVLVITYQTTRAVWQNIQRVLPKVEALLDTSQSAVSEGARKVAELTVKGGEVLDSARRAFARQTANHF